MTAAPLVSPQLFGAQFNPSLRVHVAIVRLTDCDFYVQESPR